MSSSFAETWSRWHGGRLRGARFVSLTLLPLSFFIAWCSTLCRSVSASIAFLFVLFCVILFSDVSHSHWSLRSNLPWMCVLVQVEPPTSSSRLFSFSFLGLTGGHEMLFTTAARLLALLAVMSAKVSTSLRTLLALEASDWRRSAPLVTSALPAKHTAIAMLSCTRRVSGGGVRVAERETGTPLDLPSWHMVRTRQLWRAEESAIWCKRDSAGS